VRADVSLAGTVGREAIRIEIAAVTGDTGTRDEFLAAIVEIDRRKQISIRTKDNEANERRATVGGGVNKVVHGDTGDQVLAGERVVDDTVDFGLSFIVGTEAVADIGGGTAGAIGNRVVISRQVFFRRPLIISRVNLDWLDTQSDNKPILFRDIKQP
jgi:hypothetical protein